MLMPARLVRQASGHGVRENTQKHSHPSSPRRVTEESRACLPARSCCMGSEFCREHLALCLACMGTGFCQRGELICMFSTRSLTWMLDMCAAKWLLLSPSHDHQIHKPDCWRLAAILPSIGSAQALFAIAEHTKLSTSETWSLPLAAEVPLPDEAPPLPRNRATTQSQVKSSSASVSLTGADHWDVREANRKKQDSLSLSSLLGPTLRFLWSIFFSSIFVHLHGK